MAEYDRVAGLVKAVSSATSVAAGRSDAELNVRTRELCRAIYRYCHRYSLLSSISLRDLGIDTQMAEMACAGYSETSTK